MLIVVAGFPGAFIGAFFTGSLLIEQVFSLDGLGYLSFNSHHESRLSRRARQSLHLRADRPRREPPLRPHLYRGSIRASISRRGRSEVLDAMIESAPRRGILKLGPMNRRRLDNFRRNRRGYWSFWIFAVLFVISLFAEFVANDRPLIASYKGEILFPVLFNYRRIDIRRVSRRDRLSRPLHRTTKSTRMAGRSGRRSASPTTRNNLALPTPAPSPPTWS